MGDDALARLVAGLSVLGGVEAMVVLRDICHFDADDGLALSEWAARALIAATLESARA